MNKMNLTPLSELIDETWGPIGTPERDAMEAQLKEDLNAYFVGEAIKKARKEQHLTQAQLGEKVGVQKAQISKLEKGRNMTISSLGRVFKALGVTTATLDLGSHGRYSLWG